MEVFQLNYDLFGQHVVCTTVQAPEPFKLEVDMYRFIKKHVVKEGYMFLRIDTTDQRGYPDITLFREQEYQLIEAKLLKKNQLESIADDLRFEFGQLAFAVRALSLGLNYTLAVGRGRQLAIIQGIDNPWKMTC